MKAFMGEPKAPVDSLMFNSKKDHHGVSVRRPYPWPNRPTVDELYLVYITEDNQHRLKVSQWSDRVGIRGIDAAEIALTTQAKGGGGSATSEGVNFDTLHFKKPSYFTMVLDHPQWKFYNPATPF